MLPILLFLCLCGLVYFYISHRLNYWKHKNIPHVKWDIFFNTVIRIPSKTSKLESPAKILGELYKQFDEPFFGFYAFTVPWLLVKDPNLIKKILIQDSHVFPNRYIMSDESIDPILSNGLFGIKTPQWKRLRTKVSPVFSSGKIKAMLPLMVNCGENLLNYINNNINKSIESKELAAKYTTDVITSCAFGIEANSFLHKDSEFRIAGRKMFQATFPKDLGTSFYFFAHLLVKIFKLKFFDDEPIDFLRNVFNETIQTREISKVKRNDLIDILIELKNAEEKDDEFKFCGDRLVAQAVTFFGAGHETTSSAIAFTLHELCLNSKIQDRLRKEIADTIEQHSGLSYESIFEMKYLHMIICETLRKYPLTAFLIRQCAEDYRLSENGHTIEKGTPIMISQDGLHWDPEYFPKPEVYDPERFDKNNKDKLTQYSYLPFGEGPRNCIGERFGLLTTKLGIIYIIKNFKVEKCADTHDPLVFGRAGLLHAVPGVFVKFNKLSDIVR